MPGGVPRTSTLALTNATLLYGLKLAKQGWRAACKADPALRLGLNVVEGKVVYPAWPRRSISSWPTSAPSSDPRPAHPAAPRRGPAAPQRLGTPGSAGYDVASAEETVPAPLERRAVATGFMMALPRTTSARSAPARAWR